MESSENDDESVVGDECHIISNSTNGPRYDPDFEFDLVPVSILRILRSNRGKQKDIFRIF